MELSDISWDVTEQVYREDPALNYSSIKAFSQDGFSYLLKPKEDKMTDSMIFGSVVDSLITEGTEGFEAKFYVAESPVPSGKVKDIVDILFSRRDEEKSFDDVSDGQILDVCNEVSYQPGWKPETRIRSIRENGKDYYNFLVTADDRIVISTELYNTAVTVVTCLKTNNTTSSLFADDTEDVKHEYQLKFKTELNDVEYKCMPDLIIVDHENKTISPYDLKTTGTYEWEFYKRFLYYRYDIQARLYYRILNDIVSAEDSFKDYTINDWTFIVINKDSLTPLLWSFDDTKTTGTLTYGKIDQIQLQDPQTLGEELARYIEESPDVPEGINKVSENSLTDWLDEM